MVIFEIIMEVLYMLEVSPVRQQGDLMNFVEARFAFYVY